MAVGSSVKASLLALHDSTTGDLHDHVHEVMAALQPQPRLAAQVGWDEAQHRLLDSWRKSAGS